MNRTTSPADTPAADYAGLTPDTLLDAVETSGCRPDGRLLALNSYENRVYQVGIEDADPLIAKFYRPSRWCWPSTGPPCTPRMATGLRSTRARAGTGRN